MFLGLYQVLTLFEKIREFLKKTQPEIKFPEIEYKTFELSLIHI